MSEHVELGKVALNGDSDGFLSRQCPSCRRVFKRPISRMQDSDASPAAYCPYCGATPEGRWDTDAQAAYFQAHAARLGAEYVATQFREMLEGLSSSFLQVSHEQADLPPDPGAPPPESLEGFRLVRVPCHPDDPLKIDAPWSDDVACPLCGITYPISDVAGLGSSQ